MSPAVFRGFVVVSGAPASGESTLAPALAAELDLPLLAGSPVAGGWPVLEVDTGVAVDVAALARRIRTATSLP